MSKKKKDIIDVYIINLIIVLCIILAVLVLIAFSAKMWKSSQILTDTLFAETNECIQKYAPQLKTNAQIYSADLDGTTKCLINKCQLDKGYNLSSKQIEIIASCKIAGVIN